MNTIIKSEFENRPKETIPDEQIMSNKTKHGDVIDTIYEIDLSRLKRDYAKNDLVNLTTALGVDHGGNKPILIARIEELLNGESREIKITNITG